MNILTIPSFRVVARRVVAMASLAIVVAVPYTAGAATKYAAPTGSADSSGDSRSDAWNASSCFTKLSPGDVCIYSTGNYGKTRFAPRNSGNRSNVITHRCESLHACTFDQLEFRDVSYVHVENIASDTHYYDASKTYANPRMAIYDSHHLKFDSISVRGEPKKCADGNPGPDCPVPSEHNRYNDLVRFGAAKSSTSSWAIEITGESRFVNGNHSVMQFHDDDDDNYCESNESDIWIHGTPAKPIHFSSEYHHLLSFKGACRVLIEYANLGPAGTGRGDLNQPNKTTTNQTGGIVHGSTMQNVIVRFSNFSMGGSATDINRNGAHIEIGMFGDEVNGACFPHNSHFRPWGPLAVLGRNNSVTSVRNVSIVNNAVAEPWYLQKTNGKAASSPYLGYLMARVGNSDGVDIDIDGIITTPTANGLLFLASGSDVDYLTREILAGGVRLGKTIIADDGNAFGDPKNWDFSPVASSPLLGAAVPLATATSSGSGTTISVDRPECFAGTMSGMRRGDDVLIGGKSCTVANTNLAKSTITCSQSLSWSAGDKIYYELDGAILADVGSRTQGTSSRPKPPSLQVADGN